MLSTIFNICLYTSGWKREYAHVWIVSDGVYLVWSFVWIFSFLQMITRPWRSFIRDDLQSPQKTRWRIWTFVLVTALSWWIFDTGARFDHKAKDPSPIVFMLGPAYTFLLMST